MRRDGTLWFVLLAAALRLPGLWTDFWLDEIWALDNVGRVASPVGVFTEIHHDSNHWLISLWMYVLGQDAAFWAYRLPSLVAGVLAVPVAGRLAGRLGASRPLTMLLVAVSFPLGFYASEARGYAIAATAGLASFYALHRWVHGQQDGRWLAMSSLASVLGVLGHLSFVAVLAAEALFLAIAGPARRLRWPRLLLPLVAPAALLVVLAVIDLRFLQLGGGPPLQPRGLLADLGALVVGAPLGHWWTGWVAWIGAGVVLVSLARAVRSPSPGTMSWAGFVFAVTVLPVVVALAVQPPFLFPRYFLVCLAFVPLLVAGALPALPARARHAMVAILVVLNLVSWLEFWRDGRGHYRAALSLALQTVPDGPITIASDHDFRNRLIVDFYRGRLGADGARLVYVAGGARFHVVSGPSAGAAELCGDCRLLRAYPATPLSGAPWRVYQRSGADTGTAGPVPSSGVK